jgi:crossover junction endodeoxyribonuclease RuvC
MRLVGLDPGLRHTGWGIIEVQGNSLRYLACGVVDSPDGEELAPRLVAIYRGLVMVIERWKPFEAAVEETVVNRNALSSLKLGHARGVVLLAASHAGLGVQEYAARQVKKSLTGTGGAGKDQVAVMVRHLLPGCGEARADAYDALAVAITHAHFRTSRARIAAGRTALMGPDS